MKRIIGFVVVILISGCVGSKEIDSRLNQDFLSDLASENNRVAGDLYLESFSEDLSNLTYDYYLSFITKNEAPSAKGFSNLVKNADYHYFRTQKESFVIALYYKNENTIVCDNSNTSFIDSIKVYGLKDSIPELVNFAKKFINR
ncbi:hypothetical protein C0389_00625 [bacterium]|nr:hypothetical protein [bacterium]